MLRSSACFRVDFAVMVCLKKARFYGLFCYSAREFFNKLPSMNLAAANIQNIDANIDTNIDNLQALVKQLVLEVCAKDQQISMLGEQVQQHQAALREQQSTLSLKSKRIRFLELYLVSLRQQRYGRSSEAFNPEQARLFEETTDSDIAQLEAELEQLSSTGSSPDTSIDSSNTQLHGEETNAAPLKPTKRKPVRIELPEDLERIKRKLAPKHTACSCCGGALRQRSEEISEKLAIKAPELYVQQTIRPIMACSRCELQFYTPSAAEIIDRGIPDPSLLAYVLYEKYHQHVPLYRQLSLFVRAGLHIGQSTLCDWVGRCGAALEPLANRLRVLMQQQAAIHVDETPVVMLTSGAKKNGKASQQAYLFAYRGAELGQLPIVAFDFNTSRSGSSVATLLSTYQGALVVDDYAGYKRLFVNESKSASQSADQSVDQKSRPPNLEIACFAHARRKFFELYRAQQSPLATQALTHIAEIYRHEAQAKDLTPEDRHRYRQTHTAPLINAYMAWLKAHRVKVNDGTGIARAIDYTLKREASFRSFLTDGRFPIDNNPVENAIRPVALGRKNWLFAGSQLAGERAASIMSLMETARANGLDVLSYLTDLLTRLPTTKDHAIDSLLPMFWKPAT
jgi:transposase